MCIKLLLFILAVYFLCLTPSAFFCCPVGALFNPHMPIGKVWICHLLFVILCLCTVTDFSAEDKASGVNFARWFNVVLGRESPILGNFAPPEAQNWVYEVAQFVWGLDHTHALADASSALVTRRIGMCGYTAVPEDGRTCLMLGYCWYELVPSCITKMLIIIVNTYNLMQPLHIAELQS